MQNAMNPTGRSQNAESTAQAARTRVEHITIIEKLESLLANEGYQFFAAHFRKGADFCKDRSKAIEELSPEQRDAYAQRFYGMDEMLAWPEKQLTASRGIVAEIERTFGKQAEQP